MSTGLPPLRNAQIASYSTIRILGFLDDGHVSTGTGFLFEFAKNGVMSVPTIVTNKHVIVGANKGQIIFSKRGIDGTRLGSDKITVNIENFQNRCILHPDPQVDLAVFPLGGVLRDLESAGFNPFVAILGAINIPTEAEWTRLAPTEDVLVVGYPNGIWDNENNLPVVRKGITATPANINYRGKKEFLIDAAIFSGSSGSPVFIINEGGFGTADGFVIGSRYYFLGIVYAVYQYEATGEITIENIPTINKPIARSLIPNNLGLVIKSTKVMDFEPIIKSRLPQSQQ